MNDLNDLCYFAAIVKAGSLSGASRSLGVTKSMLSQHLSKLEQQLGVKLIQRTTRKLQVTPLGQAFYRHCLAVLEEVEHAQHLIDDAHAQPHGRLTVRCPVLFAQVMLAPVLGGFMREYPEIELFVDADYGDVDLIEDGYDLAFRAEQDMPDSSLVIKSFAVDQPILVASPDFVSDRGRPTALRDLHGTPSAATPVVNGKPQWLLTGADGSEVAVPHQPRLQSPDLIVLKQAAVDGVGVALLPRLLCADDLARGKLLRLLPDYCGKTVNLHAIYPSRGGLSPAARTFLDYLGENLTPYLRRSLNGALHLSISPWSPPEMQAPLEINAA